VALGVCVAALDYETGDDALPTLLYLLPIFAGTWLVGRTFGGALSLLSAGSYLGVNTWERVRQAIRPSSPIPVRTTARADPPKVSFMAQRVTRQHRGLRWRETPSTKRATRSIW
jgi:hypothetical protein